jgi:hypothetical protein
VGATDAHLGLGHLGSQPAGGSGTSRSPTPRGEHALEHKFLDAQLPDRFDKQSRTTQRLLAGFDALGISEGELGLGYALDAPRFQ